MSFEDLFDKKSNAHVLDPALAPIAARYMMQLLEITNGHVDVAEELGFNAANRLFITPEPLRRRKYAEQMPQWWEQGRLRSVPESLESRRVEAAIQRVGESLGMQSGEFKLFHLMVICRAFPPLMEAADACSGGASTLMSQLLDTPVVDLAALFEGSCVLKHFYWLDSSCFESENLSHCFDMTKPLASAITTYSSGSILQLLVPSLQQLPTENALPLSCFSQTETDLISAYLEGALNQQAKGCNVLLYGHPGVGKTSLAWSLAKEHQRQLYSVDSLSESADDSIGTGRRRRGHADNGKRRLHNMSAFYHLQHKSGSDMLLIDECEDIFARTFGRLDTAKALLHPLLETNPLPAIWITNEIDDIPESCMRRFGLVIEVKPAAADVKLQQFRSISRGLRLSTAFLRSLATIEGVTPGHVETGCKALRLAELSGAAAEKVLQRQLQTVLGLAERHHKPAYKLAGKFDPAFLSYQGPKIQPLIDQLKHSGVGNLLLEGPPGCGKTGLAHYLAEQLERPLHSKSASDLLDKYVGGTEKALAEAFRAAQQENAILLLDEVDSLLSDRASHSRSWETTQVNELLMQIERFDGILIAATNFNERLDRAVMRRFDAVLRFGYLAPEHVVEMFSKLFSSAVSLSFRKQLVTLRHLTPGDFAVIRRRRERLQPDLSPQEALEELVSIESGKLPQRTIGFVH